MILRRRTPYILFCTLCLLAAALLPPSSLNAQSADAPQPGQTAKQEEETAARRQRAREQIRQQEHQRILGVVPEFNISNVANAVPLTAGQKFSLAFKSATDPATFLVSALTAGFGQVTDNYHDYGQGMEGFGKYLGASYADTFDGTILGNAVFPALLHEDPRYFRKGTGSFSSRMAYAMLSTVRARSDKGRWVPNYGNVLGNVAAGGIANLYYPQEDRGVGLTFERAFIVTAEGALGSIFYEFWPDVVRKVHKKKQTP